MLPLRFQVRQNYPNPFRGRTTIKYCVAYTTMVKLTVYDCAGKTIERLVDEEKKAGTYEVEFLPAAGSRHLAGGVYVYRLEAGEFSDEKTMELME
jgi:hypothetical protein